jgi:hypothetical protein
VLNPDGWLAANIPAGFLAPSTTVFLSDKPNVLPLIYPKSDYPAPVAPRPDVFAIFNPPSPLVPVPEPVPNPNPEPVYNPVLF